MLRWEHGDWNDGMNNIKGQSVWLSFFLYDVLNRFCKICDAKKDYEKTQKYQEVMQKLKEVLNNIAWDGKWFKRAFFRDGTPLRL